MVPKKRGRPKKVVVDDAPKSEIKKRVKSESIELKETVDTPKKRGRKSKSIENNVISETINLPIKRGRKSKSQVVETNTTF